MASCTSFSSLITWEQLSSHCQRLVSSFYRLRLVRVVISRSLVQFPAGALWSVLGQDSLFHIASVYPAAKWVPGIKKAVLRACVLYSASCSGITLGGIEMVSVCTGHSVVGDKGHVSTSVDTRLETQYL